MTVILRRLVGTVGGRIAGVQNPAFLSFLDKFKASVGFSTLKHRIGDSDGNKLNCTNPSLRKVTLRHKF